LRTALAATFRDPEYLADCAGLRLECDEPASGRAITDTLARAYRASPDAVQELRRIYQAGDAK
jgi:hypothetical protein